MVGDVLFKDLQYAFGGFFRFELVINFVAAAGREAIENKDFVTISQQAFA